jgi:N-acetylneuraminic acid mutarotase
MWKAVIVGVAVMAVVVPHGDTVFGSTGTWSTKAPMPTPRYGHGVGVVNGIVYAVGGYSTSYLNTVEAYDPSTNTWSTKAPMPTARCCLGVVGVNGILYAVGGVAGIGLLNFVEAYDPSTNTWSTTCWCPGRTPPRY